MSSEGVHFPMLRRRFGVDVDVDADSDVDSDNDSIPAKLLL